MPISRTSIRHQQAGAAIITALLVVMLVATIATYLLAQQSQLLTRTARSLAQTQAMLYAQPMLDWARTALWEDQRQSATDHLGEFWAKGLVAMPIEGATASGLVHDEAGLFNLNNLVNDAGNKSEPDEQVFTRLLKQLKLEPALAVAIIDWIDNDSEVSANGGLEEQSYLALPQPYRPPNHRVLQIEEIRGVRGMTAEQFNRLRPFITALPVRVKLNVNTAPEEVLHAALPQLDVETIRRMVTARQTQPYRDMAALKDALKQIPAAYLDSMADVKSDFFSAMVAVNNGDADVRLMALFRRNAQNPTGWPVIIWVKTF